ncbi:MAG: hypothetical protein M1829_002584 [Trizodia sp. TS-e1964]|nr:MAG: hypothetical protein M1829_002584 [Trizodia sp. TS-e1964]
MSFAYATNTGRIAVLENELLQMNCLLLLLALFPLWPSPSSPLLWSPSFLSPPSASDSGGEAIPAIEPFPAPLERPTAAMLTLTALPRLCNPETRSSSSLNLFPIANVEAVLLQMVGAVRDRPCTHWRRGFGKFVLCVAVPGLVGGSCGNCHWNNEGLRCSLRPAASAATVAAAINRLPVPDAFGDMAARSSPATRSTARRAILTPVSQLARLPAGSANSSGVYPRASGRLLAPSLASLPAPPRSYGPLHCCLRRHKGRSPFGAERQHAMAQYHEALSARPPVLWEAVGANIAQSQQIYEALGEMSAIHHKLAILHEEEADRMDEDGNIS